MQKIFQRTERATRVAARKRAKALDHKAKGESWERFETTKRIARGANQNIRIARHNRREDWETGALAPRRDVGEHKTTYGAVAMYDFQLPEKDPHKRPKWMGVSRGDRVVVMKGREKGKIGIVTDVNQERGSVTVKGVNMTDIRVPDWINQEDETTTELAAMSMPMLLEDVKLVYPLPDPETGIPRDVIIDRLMHINFEYDKNKREWTEGHRLIPGTNTIIPWPEKAEPAFEDFEDDTLRITVEEQTFRPFLLHPPMPLSVIDELRNKYSRFRTRHDWEYVEKKDLEDARDEKRKGLAKGMRTPLQELADARKEKKELEQKELTEEQLARIGEVIAQERVRATNAIQQMSQ